MDSEVISGIKAVPYISPSSPPPIDSTSAPTEFDDAFGEYCDHQDVYDITDNLDSDMKILEKEESLPFSTMSPPPLSCVALPSDELDDISPYTQNVIEIFDDDDDDADDANLGNILHSSYVTCSDDSSLSKTKDSKSVSFGTNLVNLKSKYIASNDIQNDENNKKTDLLLKSNSDCKNTLNKTDSKHLDIEESVSIDVENVLTRETPSTGIILSKISDTEMKIFSSQSKTNSHSFELTCIAHSFNETLDHKSCYSMQSSSDQGTQKTNLQDCINNSDPLASQTSDNQPNCKQDLKDCQEVEILEPLSIHHIFSMELETGSVKMEEDNDFGEFISDVGEGFQPDLVLEKTEDLEFEEFKSYVGNESCTHGKDSSQSIKCQGNSALSHQGDDSTKLELDESDCDKELGDFSFANDNQDLSLPNYTQIESKNEFGDFTADTSNSISSQNTIAHKEVDFESDDEFGDYSTNITNISTHEEKVDLSKFSNFENGVESQTWPKTNDEFGDFASIVDPAPPSKVSNLKDENTVNFADFSSCFDANQSFYPLQYHEKPCIDSRADTLGTNKDSVSMKDSEESILPSKCKAEILLADQRNFDAEFESMISDDDEYGDFSCVEETKGLQLEFSDDEEQSFNEVITSASDNIIKVATTEQVTSSHNKFQALISRWISSSSSEKVPLSISKLLDIIENDSFIWQHLQDLDSSLALKLSWPNSHINKLFLSALNVDARNILFGHKWTSSIPLFAQTLGFSPLIPAKPSISQASKPWIMGKTPLGQHPLSETEQNVFPMEHTKMTEIEPKMIPPAQFDWSSSGLTNPLDASGGKEKKFDRIDSKDSFAVLEETTTHSLNPSPVLQKILKESGSGLGSVRTTDVFSLPEEVKAVVQKLPDLNFMRSKVLMFPISDGT